MLVSIDLYAYQPTIIIEVLIYRLFFIDSLNDTSFKGNGFSLLFYKSY